MIQRVQLHRLFLDFTIKCRLSAKVNQLRSQGLMDYIDGKKINKLIGEINDIGGSNRIS